MTKEDFRELLDSPWGSEFRKQVQWVLQSVPVSIRLWGVDATVKKAEEKILEAYLDSLVNLRREGKLLQEEEEKACITEE